MKGDAVGIISERARDFLPYDLETRLRSVRRAAESGWSIRKALACCKAKRTSFWRWRKRYGGTDSSLADRRSHRPHSGHPRKAPKKTTCKIKCLRDQAKRNGCSSVDIRAGLNGFEGFSASCSTVLRCLKRLDGMSLTGRIPREGTARSAARRRCRGRNGRRT